MSAMLIAAPPPPPPPGRAGEGTAVARRLRAGTLQSGGRGWEPAGEKTSAPRAQRVGEGSMTLRCSWGAGAVTLQGSQRPLSPKISPRIFRWGRSGREGNSLGAERPQLHGEAP